MDFRQVLPERVLGSALIDAATLNAAMGPMSSRTRAISSVLISCSLFLESVRNLALRHIENVKKSNCSLIKTTDRLA